MTDNESLLGWKASEAAWGSEEGKFSRDNLIAGDKWTKSDFAVWTVNESQHNNIGEVELTVCANDRESLEQFIKDFCIESEIENKIQAIEENTIVHWWA